MPRPGRVSVRVSHLQQVQREHTQCPTLRLAWHVRPAPFPPTLGPQVALTARQDNIQMISLLIAIRAILGCTRLEGPLLVRPAPWDITNRAMSPAAVYCAQEECTNQILTIWLQVSVMLALLGRTHP